MRFFYYGMKNIFLVDSVVSPPHLITENKMRFEKVGPLLDFLFLWDNGEDRVG